MCIRSWAGAAPYRLMGVSVCRKRSAAGLRRDLLFAEHDRDLLLAGQDLDGEGDLLVGADLGAHHRHLLVQDDVQG